MALQPSVECEYLPTKRTCVCCLQGTWSYPPLILRKYALLRLLHSSGSSCMIFEINEVKTFDSYCRWLNIHSRSKVITSASCLTQILTIAYTVLNSQTFHDLIRFKYPPTVTATVEVFTKKKTSYLIIRNFLPHWNFCWIRPPFVKPTLFATISLPFHQTRSETLKLLEYSRSKTATEFACTFLKQHAATSLYCLACNTVLGGWCFVSWISWIIAQFLAICISI